MKSIIAQLLLGMLFAMTSTSLLTPVQSQPGGPDPAARQMSPPVVYVAGDGTGDFNCDGISDQEEINQALDFVAANADYTTVYLKGPYTYVIDEPVIISDNTTLTGDPTAVIKLKDHAGWWEHYKPLIGQKNRAEWSPWGSEGDSIANVEIYGFAVDGGEQDEPTGDTYIPLITFYNPSHVTIHDMHLSQSYWDIVRLTSPSGVAINSNVYNNVVEYAGHEGIHFVHVTDFEAYGNYIYSTRTNCGIRVKNCNRFSLYDNIIGNSLSKSPSGYAGILLENSYTPIDSAEIYGNVIYGKNGGIHLTGSGETYPIDTRKNVHIHHNKIFKTRDLSTSTGFLMDGGIKIDGFQKTVIEYNVIEAGSTDGVVYEGDSGGDAGYETIVRNNIILDNGGYGINNKEPSVHTFLAHHNIVYNNSAGNYHHTMPADDIDSDPLFAESHNTQDTWYHIVASYDNATETFKIYVDGEEHASKYVPGFGAIGVNSRNLFLGSYADVAYWYEGREDELAIWNRALTPEEVALLYNEGVPPDIVSTVPFGLQAYFKMENNWHDSSGHDYNEESSTAGFTTEAVAGDYAGLFTGHESVRYPPTLSTASGLTISVWVYRTHITDGIQTILNKGSQDNNDHIWLYFKDESVWLELGNGDIRRGVEANVLNPWEMDYHLRSQAGRWDGSQWVYDVETSPGVDRGDPASEYDNEPLPNGGRVNIGVYGNTNEASKSPDRPQAITDLRISKDAGQARLDWSAVTQNVNGGELQEVVYRVYRAIDEPYFSPGTPYATGITNLFYLDPDTTVLTDPGHNAFYLVTALSADWESDRSNRVGSFNFALVPGAAR